METLEGPSLARLQCLALLEWSGLDTFPLHLAAALKALQVLKINHSSLKRLPPAVAEITTLRELCLEGNLLLQLHMEDLATRAALQSLRVFRVSKRLDGVDAGGASQEWYASVRFTEHSLEVLSAIRRELPLLEMPGLNGH